MSIVINGFLIYEYLEIKIKCTDCLRDTWQKKSSNTVSNSSESSRERIFNVW